MRRHRSAFTLIELLVVIAIIAILSVVVILTLNPAELLRQSRDSNRLSDLDTLNHAISLYSTDQSALSSFAMGSSSVIYVSIPDPLATSTAGDQCQGVGLPALATSSGYTYHCVASSTLRNADGTGWIPVNFKNISSGAPFGNLPVDPTNATATRSYYTYTTNGTQYEITGAMESAKYKLGGSNDAVSTDGGIKMSLAEKGTNLTLEPMDYGDASLVDYWSLDEATGSTAFDFSGSGNNGGWFGTQAGLNSTYYTTPKLGAAAGNFDGSTNYVSTTISAINTTATGGNTISFWMKYTSIGIGFQLGGFSYYNNAGCLGINNGSGSVYGPAAPPTNQWVYITVVMNNGVYGTNGSAIYYNGALTTPTCLAAGQSGTANSSFYLGRYAGGSFYTNGAFDDVRVYNRALSAAEVQAIYNAER